MGFADNFLAAFCPQQKRSIICKTALYRKRTRHTKLFPNANFFPIHYREERPRFPFLGLSGEPLLQRLVPEVG